MKLPTPARGPARVLMAVAAVSVVASELSARVAHFPLHAWLGVSGSPRYGLAWQWLTHPLVEIPSNSSVLGLLLSCVAFHFLVPRVDASKGRAFLYELLGAAALARGGLATLLLLAWPNLGALPITGVSGFVLALLGHEAYRYGGTGRFALPGLAPGQQGTELSGTQLLVGIFAIMVLALVASQLVLPFVTDLAALAVGMTYADRGPRKKAVSRTSFTVLRGGKAERTLHRSASACA